MTRYLASGPTDMWHMLSLIALMRLPSSYKVTQHTILLKAGSSMLMDSIKGDPLTEERMLACENKQVEKGNAAMQAQAQKNNNSNSNRKGKPMTPEQKACYLEWLKTAVCHHCNEGMCS